MMVVVKVVTTMMIDGKKIGEFKGGLACIIIMS